MLRFLVVITLLMALFPLPVQAQEKEKFVISGLEAPPYIFMDPQGQASGIIVDLIREAFMDIGVEPKFRISNWARAFEKVKRGEVDAIIPAIKSTDREEILYYTEEPLVVLQMVLLQNKQYPIFFVGDLRDLKPFRIGTIRKARVAPDFDAAIEKGDIKREYRANFRMLASAVSHQRLDAMAVDELMGLWGAAEEGVLDELEVVRPILNKVPVYMAISKSSKFTNLREKFSKELEKAKNSHNFLADVKKYEKVLNLNILDHASLKE